jgi:hypothetical protein
MQERTNFCLSTPQRLRRWMSGIVLDNARNNSPHKGEDRRQCVTSCDDAQGDFEFLVLDQITYVPSVK